MDRKTLLEKAITTVCQDRNIQYGEPQDVFNDIAALWSLYIKKEIKAHDVAAMMILFKIARLQKNYANIDSVIDIVGYAACFSEIVHCENNKQTSQMGKEPVNAF